MRAKILLITLLLPILLFGQEFTKFRIDNKQKSTLLKSGDSDVLMVEVYLDQNNEALEKTKYPSTLKLTDISSLLNNIRQKAKKNKKAFRDICLDCYAGEYNNQLERLNGLIDAEKIREIQANQKKDSILRAEKIMRDSINMITYKAAKEKPYDRFILAMDMFGKKNNIQYGQFTVFTNMDQELSRIRFSIYLQNNGFTYGADSKQIFRPNIIQEYYVRGVAANEEVNDYIQIRYDYTVRDDLPSYNTTILNDEYPCWLIDKVIIDGTANTIIPLYLRYWAQSKKSFGGSKIGVIAYHVFMGDRITLMRVGQNKYRIEVTKQGGGGMDYYTSYKILEQYNLQ